MGEKLRPQKSGIQIRLVDLRYQAKTWHRERRVVAKIEWLIKRLIKVGSGKFMWRRRFPWPDLTALCSCDEHGCEKWLTEPRGVRYAQKRVKNPFSSEIVAAELLGDSGEIMPRHFGVGGAVE